jgi:hypothetical protein
MDPLGNLPSRWHVGCPCNEEKGLNGPRCKPIAPLKILVVVRIRVLVPILCNDIIKMGIVDGEV